MQEITIYNKNNEPLTELAQWDKNIQLQIREKEIDAAYKVHFFNCNSKEAMVMESTYEDGTLTVPVPNDILMEPHPITGYVWMEKNSEEKSVFCFRIIVRKRLKPANYVYSDQKEYITFENVLAEAKEYAGYAEGYAEEAKSSKTDAGDFAKQAESYAQRVDQMTQRAFESEANAERSANLANAQAACAATSASTADKKAKEAKKSAAKAESFAHGNTGTRENEDDDNAKYYCEQSRNNSNISKEYLTKVEQAGADAVDAIQDALNRNAPSFQVDLSTGCLLYEGGRFVFQVNNAGHLEWGLAL